MTDYLKILKDLIFFKEPDKKEEYILQESGKEAEGKARPDITGKDEETKKNGKETLKEKTGASTGNKKNDEKSGANVNSSGPGNSQKDGSTEPGIDRRLSVNLEHMKRIYRVPVNSDVIIREFEVIVKNKAVSAFAIFFDGMIDRKIVNSSILEPLMLLSNLDIKSGNEDVASYVNKHILPQNQIKIVHEYSKVISEINLGGSGLFIDGIDVAFAVDVKGWEHRNVERPNTELLIRGPQEGFNEVMRVNTALVRKIIRDQDLVAENIEIGIKSKTPCALMYIKDIANETLVDEVRRRLQGIKVDYVIDSGELEQLIEDSTFLPSPQVVTTERPDRVATMLTEGRAAVLMHGSPFALVMPVTFFELVKSPEDNYLRFPYGNFLRFIRILAVVFSLLLPGVYLAVTNFHQEMIPTDLLLAIENSRERVPFPSIVEILIMELSFELIREAGIRIPGPIGPTLGIIGALILGQAAVAANIVSPILIIIVAVTGIGSFAIPNFSLGFSFRILRFVYIFLGATAGFLGITCGLYLHGLQLAGSKSFGVPFLAPFAPKTEGGFADDLTRAPIWKKERRPDFLNTKSVRKQPRISRTWIKRMKRR